MAAREKTAVAAPMPMASVTTAHSEDARWRHRRRHACRRSSSMPGMPQTVTDITCDYNNRYTSGEVQNAQRRAAIATSLRHSGHFFVVGSGGTSPRRMRATRWFTGSTTKK